MNYCRPSGYRCVLERLSKHQTPYGINLFYKIIHVRRDSGLQLSTECGECIQNAPRSTFKTGRALRGYGLCKVSFFLYSVNQITVKLKFKLRLAAWHESQVEAVGPECGGVVVVVIGGLSVAGLAS